jgi:hypothetical protein
MTQRMFRICILLTLGFAASQTILPAQERNALDGIWSVSVDVTNCQTGAPIRTVASLQQFRPDGSVIETANTASRGMSEGVWGYGGDKNVAALYWFFRYNFAGAGSFSEPLTCTVMAELPALTWRT